MKHISNNQLYSKKRRSLSSEQNFLTKSLEDLNLMDAFLMDVATEDAENAKLIAKVIIERATGRRVENLVVETQKQLKGLTIDKRGIRMDIFVSEQKNIGGKATTLRLYDIEPNKYVETDIPRRSRFYQSLIDSKLIPITTPFKELPDVITIWILPYDPFGEGRMIYTVKNMVVENNHILYNDGIVKLFLYTKGTKGGSPSLKELLTYLEQTTLPNAVDTELQQIQRIVQDIKGRQETKERYMTLQEMINYEKRDSYEDGLTQGMEQGLLKGTILTCKSLNMSRAKTQATLIEQYALTSDKADEYIALYW